LPEAGPQPGLLCSGHQRKPDGALRCFELAAGLYEREGDRLRAARTQSNIGVTCWNTGQYPRAFDHYQQAREIFSAIGDQVGVAKAQSNIANIHFARGDYRTARELLEAALPVFLPADDVLGYLTTAGLLAQVLVELGEHDSAGALLTEAEAAATRLDDRPTLAQLQQVTGRMSFKRGDLAAARTAYESAARNGKDMNDPVREADAHLGLAEVALEECRYDSAVASAEHARWIAHRVNGPLIGAQAAALLGRIHDAAGDGRLGNALADEARAEFAALGIDRGLGSARPQVRDSGDIRPPS
jgi:tetratricopeptide (TPR) repeat protein